METPRIRGREGLAQGHTQVHSRTELKCEVSSCETPERPHTKEGAVCKGCWENVASATCFAKRKGVSAEATNRPGVGQADGDGRSDQGGACVCQ